MQQAENASLFLSMDIRRTVDGTKRRVYFEHDRSDKNFYPVVLAGPPIPSRTARTVNDRRKTVHHFERTLHHTLTSGPSSDVSLRDAGIVARSTTVYFFVIAGSLADAATIWSHLSIASIRMPCSILSVVLSISVFKIG